MTIHAPYVEPQRRVLYAGRPVGPISGVYGLEDPRDGRVRYIGASVDVWRRFTKHLSSGSAGASDMARFAWVRGMQSEGHEPTLRLLQVIQGDGLKHAEAHWIAIYRLVGEADLNVHVRRREKTAREELQVAQKDGF